MVQSGVPTGRFETVDAHNLGRNAVSDCDLPVVIKADGLAAGKGVVIAETRDDALSTLSDIFEGERFGDAGRTVLIEEHLTGPEISAFGFVHGEQVSSLVSATDYKRALDGERGPNTGGMGSYSPAPAWDDEMEDLVRRTVFEPVASALAAEGCPYSGVLYAGLILTDDGPKVLEFNARFGDPEAQVILPRLRGDLLDALYKVATGDISGLDLTWDTRPCVGVVVTSGGYPGDYETGKQIAGIDAAAERALVFHAGTSRTGEGTITSGGRVLTVSALGDSVGQARAAAYDAVGEIHFEGAFSRSDIAL